MSDTTTHEESIFDDPNTDVEPASDEQQDYEVFDDTDDDTPKSFDKFAMKTNNKINALSQSLKDSHKLNSYFARGLNTKQIAEKDPEFAKRLSRQEEYSELFEVNSATPSGDNSESLIKEAISELIVDGKRLGLSDRKTLRENPTFNRYLKGFLAAGDSPERAANEAFKIAYPEKSSMVEFSVLSASSEETEVKKQTPDDKMAKFYSSIDNQPEFIRKRMKK